MALDLALDMGRGEGMGQVVHCQGIERKPLEEISNYSPREECHSGLAMKKKVQRITKLELKRIDPSLRLKRTGLEEEDCLQAEGRSHSETNMQGEQGGDFNEVLMGDDKFGGRPVNLGRALWFQECLDNYKMIDIGFYGPRYICLLGFNPCGSPTLPSWEWKRRILARLKGIQENLSIWPNDFLVDLERKLQIEYAEVTKLEEEFSAMKARILWLVEGDRNTAFYHTLALVRRRRNRILCMKDSVGNWLHGDREIVDFIREGFMELFTSDLCSASLVEWNPPFWHSYLNEEDATSIDIVVTDEEITAGIWGLKPLKAPGPNGLHAGFFQRFWLVDGESVKKENTREGLCEVLGFQSTPFLGKYLDLPIKYNGIPQDFGFIIDRIQSKLAGWKANLLSFAGRVVLTQAVTSTIPIYDVMSLWVRVLSHKYQGQRSRPINLLKTTSCSSTWAGIKKGEAVVSKGAKRVAGKDSGLSLWFDKWLDKGTLRSRISGPLNREEEVRLRDISRFLCWNWEGISFSFPKEIFMEIKATLIPYSKLREDRLSWSSSLSGEFHLKDAYRIANAKENKPVIQPFSGEWVLPKIKCFLWQCCHQSIHVHALLAKRGMNISSICPEGTKFLELLLSPGFCFYVLWHPILDWLRLNCRSMQRCDVADLDWAILFPIAVWVLWLH
ncbi:uncharacterized protein LOC142612031 [Castanea sativa]|uniref:uncharacterized protein LOC142612031 n=1 Tax=Castanea sativa TaxID=21020 RepID=UPI003F64EC0B